MYKISLMNVGSDMVAKDIVTTVDTLIEAEAVAQAEVQKCAGITSDVMFKQTGIEYVLTKGSNCVGGVVITGR